jgi:hypothetical protein
MEPDIKYRTKACNFCTIFDRSGETLGGKVVPATQVDGGVHEIALHHVHTRPDLGPEYKGFGCGHRDFEAHYKKLKTTGISGLTWIANYWEHFDNF